MSSNSSCYTNPIVRDGTSQQLRLVRALLPEYVSIDERNFEEIKSFVKKFAMELNFYTEDDRVTGDWYDFFDKKIDPNQNTDPHYALFQSFLELFKIAQSDLNGLTKRHLDYYYNDILRLFPNRAVPDQVFIIFELARHISAQGHLVKKGTRLKAGKDNLGRNVFYTTTRDLVVNKSQVVAIKSLFKDINCSRLFRSPIANSSDGDGGEIETDTKSWRPFGDRERPEASIGFAVSSPILYLAEGTRHVHLEIEFESISEQLSSELSAFDPANLTQAFDVSFSGEKDWILTENAHLGNLSPELREIASAMAVRFLNNCTTWEDIAGQEPTKGPVFDSPYSGYGDQKDDYDIGEPVAKRIIQKRNELDGCVFKSLDEVRSVRGVGEDKINDLIFTAARNLYSSHFSQETNVLHICRTLRQDQDSVVAYDDEVLNAALNTKLPTVRVLLNEQANTTCIYDSLIDLEIKSIKISVDVSGVKELVVQNDQTLMDPSKTMLPFGIIPVLGGTFYIGSQEVFQKKLDALKVNLEWYGTPTEESFGSYYEFYDSRPNDGFKADISILDKRKWVPLDEEKNLFDFANLDSAVSPRQQIDLNPVGLSGIDRDVNLGEVTDFDTDSQKGFIRLVLKNQDFGHREYQIVFTQKVLSNLDDGTDDVPNEPYVPQLKEVVLDYQSSETVNISQEDGEDVEQYFHIGPFGAAQLVSNGDSLQKKYFLPQFKNEGEIYIGIKDLIPSQNISLLIQMLEGSEDPTIPKPSIEWSYLSDNEWIAFDQLDIISDTTNDLLKSGILDFAIPKNATSNNTILTTGLHWLRASVINRSDAVPDFIQLATQAVEASFQDNGNDPNYLSEALPAESISKLAFSDSAISKVSQPFASFGGRVIEQSTTYYTRISERLRHKQRAITIWDYERMILEEFPRIYRVKCLNHTRFDGKLTNYSELAPGHVTVLIISNVRNRNSVNPIRPLTSVNLLDEIKTFISAFNSVPVTLHVRNPVYEPLKVDFDVKFRPGFDRGFYKRQLEDEIKAFLSPWAYEDGQDVSFNGKIHQSRIIDFIDEREYVDFVTCFKLYHAAFSSSEPVSEAIATTSASILCAEGQVNTYGDHNINVLESDDEFCDRCEDNQVDPPPVILSADSCEEEESVDDDGIDDLYDFRKPDPNLCFVSPDKEETCDDDGDQPPSQDFECVLTLPTDENYFDRFKEGFIPKKLNITYFIPIRLSIARFAIKVVEVVSKRKLILEGDQTSKKFRRMESLSSIEQNLHVYHLFSSGSKKPKLEGDNTLVQISNRNHNIEVGDYVNLFSNSGSRFRTIYLPKVTETMVTEGAILRFQGVLGDGNNVQIKRSEVDGNDRLKDLDSANTTIANIALRWGSGQGTYSLELVAREFDEPISGYNDFGWEVVSNDINYYPDAVSKGIFIDKEFTEEMLEDDDDNDDDDNDD